MELILIKYYFTLLLFIFKEIYKLIDMFWKNNEKILKKNKKE